MVLSTHLVIGGVVAAVATNNPAAALVIGFASHFVLDTLPHWDYHLSSLSGEGDVLRKDMRVRSRAFLWDLSKISADLLVGLLGLWLAASLTHHPLSSVMLAGAAGAVLPDFLQFAYFKLKWRALLWLQRFHERIHTPHKLKDWRVAGPLLQLALVAIVILAAIPWL